MIDASLTWYTLSVRPYVYGGEEVPAYAAEEWLRTRGFKVFAPKEQVARLDRRSQKIIKHRRLAFGTYLFVGAEGSAPVEILRCPHIFDFVRLDGAPQIVSPVVLNGIPDLTDSASKHASTDGKDLLDCFVMIRRGSGAGLCGLVTSIRKKRFVVQVNKTVDLLVRGRDLRKIVDS